MLQCTILVDKYKKLDFFVNTVNQTCNYYKDINEDFLIDVY